MNTKNRCKKPVLNRVTMVNLDTVQMTDAHGGGPKNTPTNDGCIDTEIYCDHMNPSIFVDPLPAPINP